ncbi:MAG: ROK family protein [Nocardioidaceae bacterium]
MAPGRRTRSSGATGPPNTGPGDILGMLRRGQVTTRREIQTATGLSRVTVAQRVDALLSARLVREAGQSTSTGGRRPLRLEFDHEHKVVLAASVNTTHSRVAALDLRGRMLASEDLELVVADGPDALLGALEARFPDILAAAGHRAEDVAGIGLSVPGPVDPTTMRPNQPPIMVGWDSFPLAEHVRRMFDVPVVVENDANAMALGEFIEHHPTSRSLVLVKVSTGIGAGLILDGDVYPGSDGGAGDIGHMRIADSGEVPCSCGSVGCLAATASGGAIARRLAAIGKPATSGSDVGRLLKSGDADAVRLTRDAGRRIGEVLAAVVCVVNPSTLVIAGDLAGADLLSGIVESMFPRSMPRSIRNLDVELGQLGDDAALVGLTHLVVDHVFSPTAVNRLLQT